MSYITANCIDYMQFTEYAGHLDWIRLGYDCIYMNTYFSLTPAALTETIPSPD